MEAERLKGKVIIKQRHETLANVNKDQEKPMVVSHSSLSKPNTSVSSSMIKQKSPQEVKKRKIPRKPKSLNSKAKQVVSDNRQNARSDERKKTRRTTFDDLYNSIEAKFTVMERAGVVLENLSAESPSFVKCMLPSNVAHGFWLFLPKEFCDSHLPSHDTTVILVDEFGDEYKTKYLLERHGLSGGWRAFSIAHRLLKGDLLVFHLVGPCKLKVHIVRVYGLAEVDAALCLMNLDDYAKRTDSDHVKKGSRLRKKAKKCAEPFPSDVPQLQENIRKNGPRISNTNPVLIPKQSDNNSIGFGSAVVEDSEISNYSESSYSHDHLLDGIHCR